MYKGGDRSVNQVFLQLPDSVRLCLEAFQLAASDRRHFRRPCAHQYFHAGKPRLPSRGANCCLLREAWGWGAILALSVRRQRGLSRPALIGSSRTFRKRGDSPRGSGDGGRPGNGESWPSALAIGLDFCPSSLAPTLLLPQLASFLSPAPEFPLSPPSSPSQANPDVIGQRECEDLGLGWQETVLLAQTLVRLL